MWRVRTPLQSLQAETASQISIGQPIWHIGLRSLRKVVALSAQILQFPHHSLVENRCRQATVAFVEMRLKHRENNGPLECALSMSGKREMVVEKIYLFLAELRD